MDFIHCAEFVEMYVYIYLYKEKKNYCIYLNFGYHLHEIIL